MRDWKRILYLVLGWLSLALGIVGLFLPIVPAVPFLLLASSCFVRSSPRLRRWLENSRWFGPLLRDPDKQRAAQRWLRISAVVLVAGALALSLNSRLHWAMRAVVVVVGLASLALAWWLPLVPEAPAR